LERGSVAYAALFAADEAGAVCGEAGGAGAGAGLFPGASSFFRLSAGVSAVPPLSGFGAGGGLGASRSSHWWRLNPFPEGASFFTRNLIMNFQGLRFEKPGNYSIDLTVDGELASRVPFRVVQVQEEAAQA